jgi:hypothetical protein
LTGLPQSEKLDIDELPDEFINGGTEGSCAMSHDYIHLNFHCVVGFMKCEKGKVMMSWTILLLRQLGGSG